MESKDDGIFISDEFVASACVTDEEFKLDLGCSPGTGGQPLVIDIQWSGTYFGQSETECIQNNNTCCPHNPHCTVHVTEDEHLDHWRELDLCNQQEACSVAATQVNDGCPDETDHEVVTYRCVPPGWDIDSVKESDWILHFMSITFGNVTLVS